MWRHGSKCGLFLVALGAMICIFTNSLNGTNL
jgi:hypothetical protein